MGILTRDAEGTNSENFVPVSVISNGWSDLTVPLSSSEKPQIYLLQCRRSTGNYNYQDGT